MKDTYYSKNAISVYQNLYLAYDENGNQIENIEQCHNRVANFLADTDEEAQMFKSMLDDQVFRINTPAMVNAGVENNPNLMACFVLGLKDDMESIKEMWNTAATIYEGGGGCGIPITNLREKNALISSGGRASGPSSYAKVIQSISDQVKSGGRCLAPFQKVYTTQGCFTVKDLAETNEKFATIVFDRKKKQKKAREAIAYESGRKIIYKLETTQDCFYLSADHSIILADGRKRLLKNLAKGDRLKAFNCHFTDDNYIVIRKPRNEIPLKDTHLSLHRMIAQDILGWEIDGYHIHHRDDDKTNNEYENFLQLTPSEHSQHHCQERIEKGHHPFQTMYLGKFSTDNPMHSSSDFWKNEEKVKAYKNKQSELLYTRGKETILSMQNKAARKRTLNTGYYLLNQGYDISNIQNYRNALISEGKSAESIQTLQNRIEKRFDSYENFLKEINNNNNKVTSIEKIGSMPVYDVEIQCKEEDGNEVRNFPIVGENCNEEGDLVGKGIFVSNSRRAANLLSFDYNHPDAFEITKCKDDKQSFQAMNLSMLVDNHFMQGVDDENHHMVQISPKNGSTEHTFYTKQLWNTVIEQAWKSGDPGLLFCDRVNEDNPTPSLGEIKCTNPCSEIPGLPWTSCVLGHWNLNKFLAYINYEPTIDWEVFDDYIYWGVLLLNKIIDKTAFPNQKFHDMMQKLRPIGMGFMGLADVLYKMRISYGSQKAQQLVENVQEFITQKAFRWSKILAEDGTCPKVDIPSEDATNFTRFLEKFDIPSTFNISNTQVTCIAPTGSTAISADCSYGFEPHMALVWDKQLADSDQVMHFFNNQFKEECNQQEIKLTDELIDKIKKNKGSIQGINEFPKDTQKIFVTAHDIDWKSRIDMQAAAQKWTTMSISSTINLPNSATKEDVAEVYKYAWQQKLKGITIFRDGCLGGNQPIDFGGQKATKRERPKALNGITHKLKTGSGTLYLTINEWEDEPFEVFATVGKSGRSIAAKAESLGRMVSLGLRSGISIKEIIRQLEGIGGDYQLFQEGRLIKSIPDGIAHILKDEYLNEEQASQLARNIEAQNDSVDSASICPKCGQPTLRMDGSCRGGQCMNPECMFSNCS